jgi:hypothetical protein
MHAPASTSRSHVIASLQVLYELGVVNDLFDLDGSSSWPEGSRLVGMCHELQNIGCCPFSFQRLATAFLVATCHFYEASVLASLSSVCSSVGVALPCTALHFAAVCQHGVKDCCPFCECMPCSVTCFLYISFLLCVEICGVRGYA